ncbi:uncharacterized protein [Neodiprion pinetum]|uniref:uncharacterized protein n=1 Tax=Neodiprion pinetum TaxID=441929 RepID=UPI00371D4263
MKLDFREKRYVGFPLQIRCPLNLDSRGMRWTRRTRISARYNPRWSSVVVGGGWLWLEVDEKEDQEDKENKVVEDDEDSCTVQPEVVIGGCSRWLAIVGGGRRWTRRRTNGTESQSPVDIKAAIR